MVAEEGLPWSAGCCGASPTIVSVRSRRHISRRGDFPTPAGLLAPPGECGEQVPAAGSPGFRADGHAELAHQAIDSRARLPSRGDAPHSVGTKVFALRPVTRGSHGARPGARVVVLAGGQATAGEPLNGGERRP